VPSAPAQECQLIAAWGAEGVRQVTFKQKQKNIERAPEICSRLAIQDRQEKRTGQQYQWQPKHSTRGVRDTSHYFTSGLWRMYAFMPSCWRRTQDWVLQCVRLYSVCKNLLLGGNSPKVFAFLQDSFSPSKNSIKITKRMRLSANLLDRKDQVYDSLRFRFRSFGALISHA